MKIFWRNEALCMRAENNAERLSLNAIYQSLPSVRDDSPVFSGSESESKFSVDQPSI
jgi:hypothetical protein